LAPSFDVQHTSDRDLFFVVDQFALLLLHGQMGVFFFLLKTINLVLDVLELLVRIILDELEHLDALDMIAPLLRHWA